MSKELDLINELIEGIDNYEKQTGIKNPPAYISRETLVRLQQALKRLEEIENVNSNGALICLENISNMQLYENIAIKNCRCDDINTIKQALIKAQEQEKVLKIIKEKEVDIQLSKHSENWLDYYTRFKHRTGKNTELTEEEFELLNTYFGKNIQK